MIQDAFNVNMGYLSLFINIPLLIAAFLVLNREFAVKNLIFILIFSLSVVLLERVDLSPFLYATATGTSIVLAPVAAGTLRGILYVATLNLNGAAGGIDIISALIKHHKPHLDLMNIVFCINMIIAASSYFVYGMSIEPVLCSIIYAFLTSFICSKIRISKKEVVKFEIITHEAEQLCLELTCKLKQKATIINACGAYSGQTNQMVICVVKKNVAPYIEEMLLSYKESVVFKSIVDDSVLGIAYK